MSCRFVIAALFGSALLFRDAATLAESPADALAQVGLLGRWSHDCSRPVMGINPYVVIERVAGGTGAQYRHDFGSAGSVLMAVDNVRVLAPATFAMRVSTLAGDKDPMSHELVIRIEGDRYRTMSSVGTDGKVRIRDGILVASGNPSPWNYRCGN